MEKRVKKRQRREETEQERHASRAAERQRDNDQALAEARSERERRELEAKARGIPHGQLAELERVEAILRRVYRQREYPNDDKLGSAIASLAAWGHLVVELPPAPSKEVRRIAERALMLNRNLRLWGAACHLQGIRARDDETCENEVRSMIRALYGDAADTVDSLAKALTALGTCGGESAPSTPVDALIAAMGQPNKTTRKSLGQELQRLLALGNSDPVRKELEACISKLLPEEQDFVRLVYGPNGGWKEVERKWSSARRQGELRRGAVEKLMTCLPRLARFVE